MGHKCRLVRRVPPHSRGALQILVLSNWFKAILILRFTIYRESRAQDFHSCVTASKAVVREAGLQMFQYLDDWLNMAKHQAQAQEQTLVFVEKCVELGLMVNLEKSELIPTQVIDFLGFTLDFRLSRIFPQSERLVALKARLRKALCEKMRLRRKSSV